MFYKQNPLYPIGELNITHISETPDSLSNMTNSQSKSTGKYPKYLYNL